jgi:glyoxylase-like metal-dependent hydrolase (beta-lactamase superfamily II)
VLCAGIDINADTLERFSMAYSLGRFTLHEIRDGTFALDGGAMFGVVPRVVWEKTNPPDARNRIPLALRCMLIEDGRRRILVDDGIGDKWNEKHREMYAIDHTRLTLDSELARAGIGRASITDVVLTHLHFDHAGGTTTRSADGSLEVAFPNATFHVQRRNWEWAMNPSDKDAGSYLAENFAPLEQTGRLHLLEGESQLAPGIDILVADGHTPGLQLVRVSDGEGCVVHCADLIPTSSHLKPHYLMGYDLEPLKTIEEKKVLLAEAIEDGWILYFEHDPRIAACTVTEKDGHVAVDRIIAFS